MKSPIKFICTIAAIPLSIVLLSSFFKGSASARGGSHFVFPYKEAGLTQREAAAHLLNRFTYGATPNEVDAVTAMGLENWFEQQLNGGLSDDSLNNMLTIYDAINLTNTQVANAYPRAGQVLQMAIKDGVINKDSAKIDQKEYRQQLAAYLQGKNMRPQQELFRQFINQKILRAAYTHNQLQEILTDFWFNHFNVSITKNDCAEFIPAYERDVIRPNALSKFENLLMATAKSPAMLYYLDNFSSAATNTNINNRQLRNTLANQMGNEMDNLTPQQKQFVNRFQQAKKNQGLNENYAREVMELHTLGVDGGYTQEDVTQAARVLTGWTVYPMGDYGNGNAIKTAISTIGEDRLKQNGFVHEGDFLFTPNRHDTKEKTVLGKTFQGNGGYQEGVELLHMLAHHPSTAHFISKKIAVRFVNDEPPQTLIDKMAKTFMDKDGDIKQVLITMVSSPEFWNKDAFREKTKSPFELAISSVRSLHASVKQPYQLYLWITKMGQKMYFYQAPTGFPDKGQYWINTGALLNRMNFGLALASQRIPGITFDLAALNNHHEPESAEAALAIYAKLIMPERNLDETVKRLTPLLNDPNLGKKVDDAASAAPQQTSASATEMDEGLAMNEPKKAAGVKKGVKSNFTEQQMINAPGNNSMLSQVAGIIIGSPEFQRK